MMLQMIIFLFGLFSQAECDFETHVYPPECIYPAGFESNDTGKDITTPDYVTLRPIERCCPQCDKCKHLGGFCALKWAVHLYKECCDFDPVEPCRDYSCKCCIVCGDDKCSPCIETGGNCRKECRADEQEDWINKCSYSNGEDGCKCCKRCEATYECLDAYGHCKPNQEYCPHGTYASTGCCGGCTCCKPVQQPVEDSFCAYAGGYCLQGDEHECAAGYYKCFGECSETQTHGGLKTIVLGTCCVPKNTGGHVPDGRRIDQFDQMMQGARRHPKQLLE